MVTVFITNKKYRPQIFKLLQGDVNERSEVPVLDAMRDFIRQVEETPDHLLRPLLDEDIVI